MRSVLAVGAVSLAVLAAAAGPLTGRRGCGGFPVDVRLAPGLPPLASARYWACFGPAEAVQYAGFAGRPDDRFKPAERVDAATARIMVPSGGEDSFYGLRERHWQASHAVVVVVFPDGATLVRVVPLPRSGGPTRTVTFGL